MHSTKRWVGAAFVAAILVVVFIVGHKFRSQRETSVVTPRQTNANPGIGATVPATATNAQSAVDAYVDAQQADPSFDWKRPIALYGKVIDENGAPLSGIPVRIQWTDLSARGTSERSLTTGPEGLFTLTGVSGKSLGVFIDAPGYSWATTNPERFEYADPGSQFFHVPSPTNPSIFRLVQRRPQSNLVQGKIESPLPHDGSEQKISLGSDAAKFGVTALAIRSFTEPRTEQNPKPSWNIHLQIEHAELIPSSSEFSLEAPLDGYAQTFSAEYSAGDPSYTANLDREIYFRTTAKPTIYGKVHVRFLAWGMSSGRAM